MSKVHHACSRFRRAALESFLDGSGAGAGHAAGCPACTAWLERVRSAPPLPASGRLYTPGLRRRTLAAAAERTTEERSRLLWWLTPAASAGVLLGVVVPTLLGARLLGLVIDSSAASLGLAAAIAASFGLASSAVPVALFLKRGKADPFVRNGALSFMEVPDE